MMGMGSVASWPCHCLFPCRAGLGEALGKESLRFPSISSFNFWYHLHGIKETSCHPLSTSVPLPLWEPVNVYVTRSGHSRWGCLLTGDGGPWIQSHSAFRSVPAGGAHSEVMRDATSQNSHQGLCTLPSGGWQEDSRWP